MKKLLIVLIWALSINAQCQPDLQSYSEAKYKADSAKMQNEIIKLNDSLQLCASEINREYYVVGGDSVRVIFAYSSDTLFYKVHVKNGMVGEIITTGKTIATKTNASKLE